MPPSKVLVVGAGAIGLRTAQELLRRHVRVVLQSPVHPLHPNNCSVGAGGLWMPFRCDDARVDRWALETLDELLSLVDDNKKKNTELVEVVPAVCLHRCHGGPTLPEFARNHYESVPGQTTPSKQLPMWTTDPRLRFQHLSVEMLSWQNTVHRLLIPPQLELLQAGYQHAWFFFTPIVNSPKMLEYLLQDVISRGADEVNVETGEYFGSVEQMQEAAARLQCDAVVNCTGLGAAAICGDGQLKGARGILLQFDRKTCTRQHPVREGVGGVANVNDALVIADDQPWGSNKEPCYLIPRGDKILIGGSYLEDDTEAGIREDERERLLMNAERVGIDVAESQLVGEWTGFRPYRPMVRCEVETSSTDGVKVAHNYGHGGSGWTVNAGAARECVDLLMGTDSNKL